MQASKATATTPDSISIPLRLHGLPGINYHDTPVSLGIPFARGAVYSLADLTLKDNRETLVHHLTKMASWPDGSIRWALLEFQVSLTSSTNNISNEKTVYLKSRTDENNCTAGKNVEVTLNDESDLLEVSAGGYSFTLNSKSPTSLGFQHAADFERNSEYNLKLRLIDNENREVFPTTESCEILPAEKGISSSIKYHGQFHCNENKESIHFELTTRFHTGKSAVKFTLLIRNERAAKHPEGLWDLGDTGSVSFKHLSLDFQHADRSSTGFPDWKPSALKPWESCSCENLSIYQESSAGENWRSEVHKNHLGEIPLQIKGAVVQLDSNRRQIEKRLCPHIHIEGKSPETGTSLYINNFWENFPTAITANQQGFSLQFFPELFPDTFELQGGEQKTLEALVDFCSSRNSLDWVQHPLRPTLPRDYYTSTDAIMYLSEQDSEDCQPFLNLIHAGINEPGNFFEKREVIDEYGWRNFGDLYADHENAYNTTNTPIISHYNNQYDPIMGFALQFMTTGEQGYFTLMDDLAKHVIDIDVYHTDEDRPEYNHGLFWHTDHYLDAFTATHRTFSKDHNPESYWDYQKGGGPGNEHCYTTGLLYHYWLTGNQQSKDTLIALGNWIPVFYKGSGTVVERLKQFASKDLKILKQVLKGSPPPRRFHPFTRATGNLVNTLLDLYLLDLEECYLTQCSEIIENTVHPADDIEQRNLLDIENNWSYTVFLQALHRFLRVKQANGFFDEHYFYARDCLVNYALWMSENEKSYLSFSDQLEHPNHTWTAQDLRKVDILANAGAFCNSTQMDKLNNKRKELLHSCMNTLAQSHEKTYTRIIALLMQSYYSLNLGHLHIVSDQPSNTAPNENNYQLPDQKFFSVANIMGQLFQDLFKALLRFSPRREYHWIKQRLA